MTAAELAACRQAAAAVLADFRCQVTAEVIRTLPGWQHHAIRLAGMLGHVLAVHGGPAEPGAVDELRAVLLADPVTLAAADGSATISAGDMPVILDALADGITLRTDRATSWCLECGTSPAGLCDDHSGQLDQADRYRVLAMVLEGKAE